MTPDNEDLVTAEDRSLTRYSSIIGPMIGGALAKPVDAFPSIFTPGSLWDRYPYLLPNLFSAICVFIGLVIGILFLEETHAEKKHNRDGGLELGKRLISYFQRTKRSSRHGKCPEEEPLIEAEEQLPGYQSTGTSPMLASFTGPSLHEPSDIENSTAPAREVAPERKPSKIFTRQIIFIIITYGILAL